MHEPQNSKSYSRISYFTRMTLRMETILKYVILENHVIVNDMTDILYAPNLKLNS